jgi:hypothetical protein
MSEPGEARTSPILIAVLLLAAVAGAVLVYEAFRRDSPVYWWFHSRDCGHHRCVRDGDGGGETNGGGGEANGGPTPAAPEPPADEHRFRALRHAAWQNDDFWAQVELGHLYNATRDNSDYDPVEAYVWYFLASINPQSRLDGEVEYDGDYRYPSVYDATKDAKRNRAHIAQLFTSDQRDEARDRITYILACRGPAGFVLLGELYSRWSPVDTGDSFSGSSSTQGERSREYRSGDQGGSGSDYEEEPVRPIAADDHDAMLYYQLAANSGSRLSNRYQDYVNEYQDFLKHDLGEANGQEVAQSAAIDAQRWHLPFAYYPGSRTRSGIPLTDECNGNGDNDQYPEGADDTPISYWNLQEALWALNYLRDPPTKKILDPNSKEMFDATVAYQKSHGKDATGRLTIRQGLDLVTEAAERQDPASEIALGKIYVLGSIQSVPEVANGDGEVWWQQVAKDRRASNYYRGMAFYDLSSVYRNGYGNVPADRAQADLYKKYSEDMRFDPRRGPRDLLCDPDELARDRDATGGDGP